MKSKASLEKFNEVNMIKNDNNGTKREVTILLELFTKLVKKEDIEKCICHPTFDKIDNISTFYENEIIPGVQVTQLPNDQIKFEELVSNLKLLGFPIVGSLLSIYCSKIDDYIYLGADPLDSNLILDPTEFENLNLLKMKIVTFIEEKLLNNLNQNLAIKSDDNLNFSSFAPKNGKDDKKAGNNKRTKERKIGYIIEKVNTWRKYYNGYYDEKGKFTKYSLDDAAKKIDISKKSLDDYLLQLRLGRKYGFNFNGFRNDKVGKLRAFVKENRVKNIEEK